MQGGNKIKNNVGHVEEAQLVNRLPPAKSLYEKAATPNVYLPRSARPQLLLDTRPRRAFLCNIKKGFDPTTRTNCAVLLRSVESSIRYAACMLACCPQHKRRLLQCRLTWVALKQCAFEWTGNKHRKSALTSMFCVAQLQMSPRQTYLASVGRRSSSSLS